MRLKSLEDFTKDPRKEVNQTGKQPTDACDDLDATDADIDAIWKQYLYELDAFHDKLLDNRLELKQHVTRDEWQAIFWPPVTDKE